MRRDFMFIHTIISVIGLGDSNFTTYQGCPQLIEKQFLRLGAKKLIETGAADDQIGSFSMPSESLESLSYMILEGRSVQLS